MLKKVLFFMIFGVFALNAYSNAIVQIRSNHSRYLKYESININVRIKNDSSQSLIIGNPETENANVTFQLYSEGERYLPMRPVTKRPYINELVIKPGKIGSFGFDLTDYYNINDVGTYKLKAIVNFGEKAFESESISFEIFNGIELVSVEKLVPGYMDKTRKYTLRYMTRGKKEVIFLRVDELERKLNYGVMALGNFVRVFEPELTVDLEGFVKIKYQVGHNCFGICYFVSDGSGFEYIDRQYVTRDGTPYNFKLSATEQGRPVPQGSSSVQVPEKRSLWDRITGKGKKKEETVGNE
jgi:hypothetical protein